MKEFFFKTLPAAMKSKIFIFGLLFILLIAGAIFFWMSWTNRTPHHGPDQTDPWAPPKPGDSK